MNFKLKMISISNLLDRALQHIATTAKYAVYYGEEEIIMIYVVVQRMNLSLMSKMASFGVLTPSKDIQDFLPGPEDWPGRFVVLQRN